MFLSLTAAALAADTEVSFTIGNAVVTYDNLDFRPLDETSDQAILDSDDRTTFAYLWVGVDIESTISEELAVRIDASHRALWGGDQIGTTDGYGGFIYVRELATDWAPGGNVSGADQEPGNHVVLVRVGRQRLGIGGSAGRDYVFDDVSDGIRVDVPLGGVGLVTLVPISIVNSAGDVANSNYADLAASTANVYNFRGANYSTRMGGLLRLDSLVPNLDLRAHLFHTDIAARGTGADISYDGLLGNFADNDYTLNYGLRGSYETGNLAVSAEFAGSGGIDRKELVATDVNTAGFAGGAGFALDTTDPDADQGGIKLVVDGFYAQGAVYADTGLLYSHGYVSMKGDQMGGLVADSLMGWHPSAYTDTSGVDDDQHDRDRKSGSLVAHGGFAFALDGGTEFGADAWYMGDTGYSAVPFADIDAMMPPYGYSREEFAATERLGRPLGIEVDGHVRVEATENLSFSAVGGALLPGGYYAIPVARVAGNGDDTQLGGTATAWAVGIGSQLSW